MQQQILIVDDHLVVRTGISIILEEKFKNLIINTTENYQETLALLQRQPIDLVILDINIPGSKNISMIQEIKNIQKNTKILIFSVYDEETHACPYIIAGASGYLNKLSDKKQITDAIDSVLKTGNYLSPEILDTLIHASTQKSSIDPLEKLSTRELEISELLVKGDGNIEIANKLNIHLTTVSTHKNKIFNKLNIKNIVELISVFNKSIGTR